MSSEATTTIKNYIRKYAKKHGISFEDAKEHAICKLTELYLEEGHENHEKL